MMDDPYKYQCINCLAHFVSYHNDKKSCCCIQQHDVEHENNCSTRWLSNQQRKMPIKCTGYVRQVGQRNLE